MDSIIMNLGETCHTFVIQFSFRWGTFSFFDEEKAMIANHLLVLCSTTHNGVQLEKEMNQGGQPIRLGWDQYTHAKSMILSLCQILLLITQQSHNNL